MNGKKQSSEAMAKAASVRGKTPGQLGIQKGGSDAGKRSGSPESGPSKGSGGGKKY